MVSVDYKSAQKAYESAKEARLEAEKAFNDESKKASGLATTDVFSQSKLEKSQDAVNLAKKNEFFADCDSNFANQMAFDKAIHKGIYGYS